MEKLYVTVSNFRIEESEKETRIYVSEKEFLDQMEKDVEASKINCLASLCAIRQGIWGMQNLCLSTDVCETTGISTVNEDKLSVKVDAISAYAYLIHKHHIPLEVTGHVWDLSPHEKVVFALYVLTQVFCGEPDT